MALHSRIRRPHFVLALAAVGAAASLAIPVPGLAAPPLVRLISASTTDPAIDDVSGVHHVAIPEDRVGRLLLFLPGSNASPQEYSVLIERAATLGYHAVGLAYVNLVEVNLVCAGMGASGCHESVRREVLFGTDESPLVEVDADNGVFHRLDRLLEYLEGIAPAEGWETYRDSGGEVRWERVLVAGHSQGAGHAAFIGRLHRVARAILFSGTEPAPWTQAGDFQTPAGDFFGFAHRLESIYTPIQRSWDNIGIPGTPTSVDGAAPPFGESRQLHTSTTACTGDPQSNGFYHNCHCADDWMPYLPDGTPAFEYVWDHLFATGALPVPATSAPSRALVTLLVLLIATLILRRSVLGGDPSAHRSPSRVDRCDLSPQEHTERASSDLERLLVSAIRRHLRRVGGERRQ